MLPGQPGKRGRNAANNRLFIDAVLWIARTGARWQDLPERFGIADTVYKRFSRWSKRGIWQEIHHAVQDPDLEWLMLDGSVIRAHQHAAGKKSDADTEALGRSRGGFTTKIHAVIDSLGNPLAFRRTPGQRHDITQPESAIRWS